MKLELSQAKFIANKGTYKPVCSYFATLDIETSNSEDDKLTWSYQQGIGLFNSKTGELLEFKETRDIQDMINILVNLDSKIENNGSFIIYVHKLSFDITFFRQSLIYKMAEKYNKKVDSIYSELLTGQLDWLIFKIGNLEFRCSYKLTQMSLYTFTKTMNVDNRKLLGANDYGVHYSDEELSEEYHKYLYNDVVGLGQAICKLIQVEHSSLERLPFTSTGFVRKDIINSFKSDRQSIFDAKKMRPNPVEFLMWNDALLGGLSQVNKRYKNKIIIGNKDKFIKHRDFVSHYPTVMLTKKYPMSKGTRESFEYSASTYDDIKELDKRAAYLKELTYSDEYLIVATVDIINFRTPEDVLAILPVSDKIKELASDSFQLYSNKIESVNGALQVTLSTPDLQSLYEYFESDMILPVNIYKYKAGRLPEQIANVIKKYFTDKSIIKEKIKRAKRNNNEELLLELSMTYSRAKAKLNSTPGMMMQKPMHDSYTIASDGTVEKPETIDLNDMDTLIKILEDYYGNNNGKVGQMGKGRCLSLLHAVFITAYGRQELLRACKTVGFSNVIYVDTDSLFYISTKETEEAIERLNRYYRQEAIDTGAFVKFSLDNEELYSYLNNLEDEKETIKIFKAISSKRYMYYSEESGLKLVCSSIAYGIDLEEDEHGNANYNYTREMEICKLKEPRELTMDDIRIGFLRFKPGVEFSRCSSKVSIYVQNEPGYRDINGHKQWVENGTIIKSAVIRIQDIDVREPDDIKILLLYSNNLNLIIGVSKLAQKEEDL